jgi:hypothetical protein
VSRRNRYRVLASSLAAIALFVVVGHGLVPSWITEPIRHLPLVTLFEPVARDGDGASDTELTTGEATEPSQASERPARATDPAQATLGAAGRPTDRPSGPTPRPPSLAGNPATTPPGPDAKARHGNRGIADLVHDLLDAAREAGEPGVGQKVRGEARHHGSDEQP